jgi:hypothetical protein
LGQLSARAGLLVVAGSVVAATALLLLLLLLLLFLLLLTLLLLTLLLLTLLPLLLLLPLPPPLFAVEAARISATASSYAKSDFMTVAAFSCARTADGEEVLKDFFRPLKRLRQRVPQKRPLP